MAKASKASVNYEAKAKGKDICGHCRYYVYPSRAFAPCTKVGDSATDTVAHGGWCKLFKAKSN